MCSIYDPDYLITQLNPEISKAGQVRENVDSDTGNE